MRNINCIAVYVLFLGLVQYILFVSSDDDDFITKSEHSANFKRNFTPNDLIQHLSRLADEQVQPRLRFPKDEDDPFYQSGINDVGVINNQQNYQDPYNYQSQYTNGVNLNQQNYENFPNYQNPHISNGVPNQQNYQNPYIDFQNNGGSGQFIGDNQINGFNQFLTPQKTRKPKKHKLNRYRPQFPISQDPLDSYYQNYPPIGMYFPPGSNNYNPQRPEAFANNPYLGLNQAQYPQLYPGQYPQQNSPGQYFGYDQYQGQGGAFSGFMDALNSIAKNDDQQCVPRLLCEVAAGGNPSYRQTSFLPSFLNTESLFTLLSALSGSVSPLLVFGRAALLGATSQGRPTSCRYAYPECPTDPDRLVDYLNNHNGGFFRFFNGLSGSQFQLQGSNGLYNQNQLQRPFDQNLLSLFSNQQSSVYPNYQRPTNYPNKFNQYVGQRPNFESLYNRGDPDVYRRYPIRYEYQMRTSEPNNKTDGIDAESRILNKNLLSTNDNHLTFVAYQNYALANPNDLDISLSFHNNRIINSPNKNSEVKFPEFAPINTISEGNRLAKSPLKFPDENPAHYIQNNRNPKSINFPNSQNFDNDLYFPKPLPFYDHSKMIFPDRTGTGNLKFDSDKLTDHFRPNLENYHYNYNSPYYRPYQFNLQSQRDQYIQESSKKKYVYIVRGNGDPNHPEIVEDIRGRNAKNEAHLAEDEVKLVPNSDLVVRESRFDKPFHFPSPYQGVVYND